MTLTLFMTLLVVMAVCVSLITEAVKKFMDDAKVKYSSNMVVLIVSIIVGAGGTVLVYLFAGIPFTTANIVCIVLMAVAIWVGSMVGYDKVLQMVEQLKTIKIK